MSHRLAERCFNSSSFHVVRGPGYACGAKRDESIVAGIQAAHTVMPAHRCLRVGCSNDYAKADLEARHV